MSAPFVSFKPAKYYKGKESYVGFFALDPASNQLKRIKVKVNHVSGVRERSRYANHLVFVINQKLYSGWNPLVEKLSKNAGTTIRQACQKFMRDKSDLRPDSLRSYKSYTNILLKWCENNGIADNICITFDKHTAQRFMQSLAISKSARTFNNYLKHYQTMFHYLIDCEIITENPFSVIKPKKADIKIRKMIPSDDRAIILDYFRSRNMNEFIVMMKLCFKCFIRPKEIKMLKILHINYHDRVLDMPPEITKNHHERVVPLTDDLMDYFISIRDQDKNKYIFSAGFRPGKKMMATHAISNAWSEMRSKLKLPASYQFYSLKDTGITEMLEAGVPAKYVKELADHHSLEMTEKYTHRSEAKKILKWNKLEF